MKNLIFTFLIALSFSVSTFSQSKEVSELIQSIEGQWSVDENGYVTYQKIIEVPDISKTILFSKVENYFAHNYKDANSVIQVSNKETGTIIGKGMYKDIHVGTSMITILVSVNHTLQIECKDGKVRATLSLTEYQQERRGGGSRSYFNYPINERYPVVTKDAEKTVMGKAFYKSHEKALSVLTEIENYIKKESSQVNTEW